MSKTWIWITAAVVVVAICAVTWNTSLKTRLGM